MNKKAARQAECVFECLYPGRNHCTRKLKCDVYLPPEDEFFKSFYSCAEEKQLFSKSEQMYACICEFILLICVGKLIFWNFSKSLRNNWEGRAMESFMREEVFEINLFLLDSCQDFRIDFPINILCFLLKRFQRFKLRNNCYLKFERMPAHTCLFKFALLRSHSPNSKSATERN